MMQVRECFVGIFASVLYVTAIFVYYEHEYKSDKTMKVQSFHSCNCNATLSDKSAGQSISTQMGSSNTENFFDIRSIINLPPWIRNEKQVLTRNISLEELKVTTRGSDQEEITAWENFFFGMGGGLMLEMGAMNGKDYSVSHFFETSAHWRVILIEGNPSLASHLAENRPQTLNFNAAICDKPAQMHFISKGNLNGIDGVLEFMSQGFLQIFYPELLKNPGNKTLDWEKVKTDKRVSVIQCLPLTNILAPLKVNHVNFFLLDVEGGELNILKAIDFDTTSFDVIAVKTDRGVDDPATTKAYVDAVSAYLTSKGYVLWTRKLGRNSWFVHPNFKPSSKPMTGKGI